MVFIQWPQSKILKDSYFQDVKFLRAICDWFLRILRVNSLTICIFAMAVIKRSDCPSDFQPKYRAHAENIVTTCVLMSMIWQILQGKGSHPRKKHHFFCAILKLGGPPCPNWFRQLLAPKASAEGACILTEMGNCYEVWLMTVVVVCVVTEMVWMLVIGSYIQVPNLVASLWHFLTISFMRMWMLL